MVEDLVTDAVEDGAFVVDGIIEERVLNAEVEEVVIRLFNEEELIED